MLDPDMDELLDELIALHKLDWALKHMSVEEATEYALDPMTPMPDPDDEDELAQI